ncbi:MAG TPA: hypothetical protein VF867_18860 [Arthrobacter sp.]
MTHAPDPRADGISTNDYCKLLPKLRYSHEAQGKILLLPSSGLVVVPFNNHTGGWDVVVVDGFGSYPVGGYHLSVGDAEIVTAIELGIGEPVPVHFVQDRAEADNLPDGSYILTRAGYSLRKGTDDAGTIWTAFLKDPVRTAGLDEALFPAKVSGTYPAKESASV